MPKSTQKRKTKKHFDMVIPLLELIPVSSFISYAMIYQDKLSSHEKSDKKITHQLR